MSIAFMTASEARCARNIQISCYSISTSPALTNPCMKLQTEQSQHSTSGVPTQVTKQTMTIRGLPYMNVPLVVVPVQALGCKIRH